MGTDCIAIVNDTRTMVMLVGVLLLKSGEAAASGQTNVVRPAFSLGATLRGERAFGEARIRNLGTNSSGACTRLDVELTHVTARLERDAAEVVYLKRPAPHPGLLGVLMKPTKDGLVGLLDLTAPLTESELKPRGWRAITGERPLPRGFQDPKTTEPEAVILGSGGE